MIVERTNVAIDRLLTDTEPDGGRADNRDDRNRRSVGQGQGMFQMKLTDDGWKINDYVLYRADDEDGIDGVHATCERDKPTVGPRPAVAAGRGRVDGREGITTTNRVTIRSCGAAETFGQPTSSEGLLLPSCSSNVRSICWGI